jgi:phosphate-selective porin
MGRGWSAIFTYDFAGGGYDDAIIEWKPTSELSFDFGLRKVNVGHEERASSGDIKAIERSSITRYFVESNNGRRLGAASYRIGAFFDGRKALTSDHSLIYGVAVTNPERSETFSDAAGSGNGSNNKPALWANVGVTSKLANNGAWAAGIGTGHLPDQGGFGIMNLGRGSDLNLYSVYTDLNIGRFSLMAEYLAATVDRGRVDNAHAKPRGFFVQPSLVLTDSIEAVVRYAWLDSDHRGVALSDVVRSAPSGGAMNTFVEWYAGANWYLRGNDLKLQVGAVYGKTRAALDGAPAEAKAAGVRSQMQVQF